MWDFGYTDLFAADGPKHTLLGESTSFVESVQNLFDFVLSEAYVAGSDERYFYAKMVAEIGLILTDPTYREDPDQWEDMEFSTDTGKFVYFVQEQ